MGPRGLVLFHALLQIWTNYKNKIAKEKYDITVSATFSYHLLMFKMIMYYSGLLL